MMNIRTYIFGVFGNEYTQYPDDFTNRIFKNYEVTSTPNLYLHREGNLLYYTYTRSFVNARKNLEECIGLSVVLNDAMFAQVDELFDVFDKVILYLVENDVILTLSDNACIVPKTTILENKDAEMVTGMLREKVAKLSFAKLPPVNYGADKNECVKLHISDGNDAILQAMSNYCRVSVVKPIVKSEGKNVERRDEQNNNILIPEIDGISTEKEADGKCPSCDKTIYLEEGDKGSYTSKLCACGRIIEFSYGRQSMPILGSQFGVFWCFPLWLLFNGFFLWGVLYWLTYFIVGFVISSALWYMIYFVLEILIRSYFIFVLDIRELSWKRKKWSSVERFEKVQKFWNIFATIVVVPYLLLLLLSIIFSYF